MKSLASEFAATFGLVLIGCGAIAVASANPGSLSHDGISAAWGTAVMAMIFAFGHVSGAHMNPAVTIALASSKLFPWAKVGPYIGAQLLGATAAGLVLRSHFGATEIGQVQTSVSPGTAFVVEVLLTMVLMLVVRGAAKAGPLSGIAIGATVGVLALVGGPLTRAGMNPARTIGPHLALGELVPVLPFVVAPIVGALLATFLFTSLEAKSAVESD